jgi:4'-phosphopantetheinyl transferase
LDKEEKQIQISYNNNGKPFVYGDPDLRFSVTHTQGLVVLGISYQFEIGVDVEHLNRKVDFEKVSGLLFTANEFELFKKADPDSQQESFINCWTRKEAFFKATGLGLTSPLEQLEITFLKGEKPGIIAAKWHEDEKYSWFLESFDLPGNYRGAIAVRGPVHSFELIHVINIQNDLALLPDESSSNIL